MAGQVLVDEQKVEKPGRLVDTGASIRLLGRLPYASRAGVKLQAALSHFGIPVQDRVCADLGASTGGFTDCLLKSGAACVYAFDVGKGQLAWELRSDPRVVVRDEFNVRYIRAEDLPDRISLITADLSFISLSKILDPLKKAVVEKLRTCSHRPEALQIDLVVLVKPQFEVGKGKVGKGGIVRDPLSRRAALESVEAHAREAGLEVVGSLPSPVPGAKGNEEFLLYLKLQADL